VHDVHSSAVFKVPLIALHESDSVKDFGAQIARTNDRSAFGDIKGPFGVEHVALGRFLAELPEYTRGRTLFPSSLDVQSLVIRMIEATELTQDE